MNNDYNRTQLLKTALEHSTITIDELSERLHLTPILLYHNLESEEQGENTVRAVAATLGIPVSYFEGGFYYNERGQLVPNDQK
ncbi:hypothetical protein [Adhaeribacter radiodurans]|uniref:Helix-turn-helix transcriptional regulator n=1 Tax=Adhaeribacter radiodurans TaxID=2745197 RepID=A0A7L7L424_9BACT|nr:hypothetical protein [Adhaeribacter radiodurans]QMU27335.1 hypothetical protein HUW48_04480 [Adhaeribacter radiodurans]